MQHLTLNFFILLKNVFLPLLKSLDPLKPQRKFLNRRLYSLLKSNQFYWNTKTLGTICYVSQDTWINTHKKCNRVTSKCVWSVTMSSNGLTLRRGMCSVTKSTGPQHAPPCLKLQKELQWYYINSGHEDGQSVCNHFAFIKFMSLQSF